MRSASTIEIETPPSPSTPAAPAPGPALRFSHADFHEPATPLCEHELAPLASEPREIARTPAPAGR